MKVLYAIQGTGNGHLSRACDVIPELQKYAVVDILVSGYQADINLPFSVEYRLYGMSFIFGKKGSIDICQTIRKAKPLLLLKDIFILPVEKYDLIINDFEPVTAWACKMKKIPCISLSHQSAVLNSKIPQPKKSDWFGKFMLKNYAPTQKQYGIHFKEFDSNIFTPVIRNDIRIAKKQTLNHYTVYLPSYDDELLIDIFNNIPEVDWHVFSKRVTQKVISQNVIINPVSQETFAQSMVTSQGVFCGAGFETPAEALFLGKKLMVIPMKNQYEQQCNAAALKSMQIPVIYSLSKNSIKTIKQWVIFGKPIKVNYKNCIPEMVKKVFDDL